MQVSHADRKGLDALMSGLKGPTAGSFPELFQLLGHSASLGGSRIAQWMATLPLCYPPSGLGLGEEAPRNTDEFWGFVEVFLLFVSRVNTELAIGSRSYGSRYGARGRDLELLADQGPHAEYQRAFRSEMSRRGLSVFLEPALPEEETPVPVLLAAVSRFMQAFYLLPAEYADWPLPEPGTETVLHPWPAWFRDVRITDEYSPELAALLSRKLSGWLVMMPPRCVALVLSVMSSLCVTPASERALLRFMRAEQAALEDAAVMEPRDLRAVMTAAAGVEFDPTDGGSNNVARHANRLLTVSTFFSCTLVALTAMFQEHGIGIEDTTEVWGPPLPQPFPRQHDSMGTLPGVQPERHASGVKFTQGDANTKAPDWKFGKTGEVPNLPVPSALSAAEGLKFIGDQMKLKGSMYRMPPADATHRAWEAWFERLDEFSRTCPAIDPTVLVSTLTASIDRDDRRIYGWYDSSARGGLLEDGSLREFVLHVRKQVLSTSTTRHEAAQELKALSGLADKMPDCVTLATKLKQLMTQLFPQGETEEPEPMLRRAALILIHNMLRTLSTKRALGPVSKAFQSCAVYEHVDMFHRFIDVVLHEGGASEKVSDEYISTVCAQLEKAHRMHVQITQAGEPLAPPVKPGFSAALSALAEEHDLEPSVLAGWVTGRGDTGNKPPSSGGPQWGSAPGWHGSPKPPRSDRGRGRGSGRGNSRGSGRGTGRGRGQQGLGNSSKGVQKQNPRAPGAPSARTERAHVQRERILNDMRERFPIGYAVAASKRPPNQEAGLKAIRDGACMICGDLSHYGNNCPARQSFKALEFMDEFYRRKKVLDQSNP